MEEYIKIKSNFVFDGILDEKYPKILKEMAFIVMYEIRQCGVIPTITSAFRKGDTGVHGFFRGIDFRSYELTIEQIKRILQKINALYKYDPERPAKYVLIYHDTGRGPHLHLQCHTNTVRVEN